MLFVYSTEKQSCIYILCIFSCKYSCIVYTCAMSVCGTKFYLISNSVDHMFGSWTSLLFFAQLQFATLISVEDKRKRERKRRRRKKGMSDNPLCIFNNTLLIIGSQNYYITVELCSSYCLIVMFGVMM